MATNDIKKKGTVKAYKNDAGGATLITEPVLGVVKNNIDPTKSGRIFVYIANFGGTDPDDAKSWVPVSYLSPFAGVVSANNSTTDGPDKTGYGKFNGNPQSYGFWASAPDIGTEVVCIFVDGRPDQGYYIGCVPQPGLISMMPAIGATTNIVPNASESQSYGGADRLPTTEVNYSNPTLRNSPTINTDPKPIHSYQASILNQQGLIRDNTRGVISSSATRETPSRVFGFSTPGGPIFEGGYTSSTIKAAAKSADNSKLQVTGRTGGHSLVMDDGGLDGTDQLVRLRTSAGHQIMMNDSGQTLFIIHSNGQSWIELGKEGTIDMFSTNSVNIRTQGDMNFHADRDINMYAKRNLNTFAENINVESDKNINFRAGINFAGYALGNYTFKVDGAMSMASAGDASYLSKGVTYVNGSKVNLNTGQSGTQPVDVPVITKINHIETAFSEGKGWINPGPEPLISVTSRAPTHQPWINSGKGVDVQVSGSVAPSSASSPTPEVNDVNNSTPAVPSSPISPSINSAVPSQPATANGQLDSATTTAMAAQQAVTNTVLSDAEKLKQGVMSGPAGATLNQLSAAGQAIKPGSGILTSKLMAAGVPATKALENLVTGNNGATSPLAVVTNTATQVAAVTNSINTAATQLVNNGVIKGTESATQIAGIVSAASQFGTNVVTGVLNGAATAAGTAISNAIAGGKFASQIADKVTSGVSGLASSASSLVSGIGNTIGNLTSSLQSTLKNAFSAVESSFKTMKAGMPNTLGGAPNALAAATLSSPSASYESAKAEVETAMETLFDAQREYRNKNTPENYAALQKAESDLAAARQKQFGASKAFLSGTTGASGIAAAGVTGAINNAAATASSLASTTLNSGVNALPGGVGAMVNQVTSGATNSLSSVSGTINNLLGAAANPLSDPAKLAGNLVKNVGDAVNGAVGKIKDLAGGAAAAAGGLLSKVQTSISSIGGASGSVKAAIAATGTFDKSSIIAKTGQLLGDPKIPQPIFNDALPDNSDVDAILAKVNESYSKVTEANTACTIQKAKIAQTIEKLDSGKVSYDEISEQLASEQKTLEDLEAKLIDAQNNYAAVVYGNE